LTLSWLRRLIRGTDKDDSRLKSRHLAATRRNPEKQELERLRRELAALEAIVVEREVDLADRRNELAAFEGLYLRQVGILYAELDECKADVLELKAQLNPCTAWQNQARAAREKARQTYESSHGEAAKTENFNPDPDLKKLFREAAKRVHPDLAGDASDLERRTRLMTEINRAYRAGDEDALREVLKECAEPSEADVAQGTGAELVRILQQISKATQRISTIDAEIARLLTSEIAQLKQEVEVAKEKGRDLLAELAAKVLAQIREEQKRHETLSQELAHNER
jgi:hypothetical protein